MTASPALELERSREAATLARLNERPADLSDLSDAAFEDGLRRVKLAQARMSRLLSEALVEDAHFGNPKTKSGKPAFKKPILLKAGAEEIRRLMRYHLRRVEPDQIVQTSEYVSVIVTLGIYDSFDRLLAVKSAACTTKEKRFLKFDGSGPIFTDAREELHNCVAMAEKRCGSLLTCEVSGATAFFANAETMSDALEEEDQVVSPWTAEEKKVTYAEAAAAGIGRSAFAALVMKTLGRAQVGTGEDVKKLRDAIKAQGADAEPTDEDTDEEE